MNFEGQILHEGDLIDNIREALFQMSGEAIAELHNSICTTQVKYNGDSEWEVLTN